ncbi:MAG TPA: tetratricopeptide repeat protein [Syntrophorhabdaceae bacterium]|nr:tetratricopeptide repeat protein [Syntrophorhabdaceae bacterium]
MDKYGSNDGAKNLKIITTRNINSTLFRSAFLSWCVAMLCIAVFFAGCATRLPVPDNPVTAKDHHQLGLRFFTQGQFDNAMREFSRAIALDPNYADAYQFRALIYRQTDFTAALSDYADVIRLRPRDPVGYFNRATAYNWLGEAERALADLDAAISLAQNGPQSGIFHSTKADILFIDGRFPEALPEYRVALANMVGNSVMAQVGLTFLTSGIVGVMLDPTGRIATAEHQNQSLEVHRTYLNERVQLCEAMIRPVAPNDTPTAISKGMSKQAVFQSVSVTDRIVGHNRFTVLPRQIEKNLHILDYPQPECWVTVTKAGPLDDRTIGVFVFTDNKLTAVKRVPLRDASVIPEGPKTPPLIISSGQSRVQVLETLRLTDRFIYEDDDFIVTSTEYRAAKDKRVRLTMLKDGKVLLSSYGSRPLW